jgi:ATP phosphoribosyltransferase
MVQREDANQIMEDLSDLGARGVIITTIRTCRI